MRKTLIFAATLMAAAGAFAAVESQELEYTGGGVTMKGYLAWDNAVEGPRPGVLVVHEWWGHNDYARKRADMLAELGYTALAVDMYGDGKQAGHPQEAGEFSRAVLSNLDSAQARFEAALAVLKAHETVDAERIGAIGYCFGGAVVLHMARLGVPLAGVVSFHGSLAARAPAEAGKIKAAILVCHGADDPFIPDDDITAFKRDMDAAGADYEFKAYPGAVHSFTNPDADKFAEEFGMNGIGYHAATDAQSWADMRAFFDRVFEK